ncbi:MAG: metallophosphoesterase, partial [Candidatus Thorarchaeota archaeon]
MPISSDYYLMAISDLHLGFESNNFTNPRIPFSKFLDDLEDVKRIDHFIVLGDFIDLWRRNDIEVMVEQNDLLERLVRMKEDKKIGTLHYLVGNHDYIVPWYVKWGYLFRRFSNTRLNLQQFSIRKASCRDIDSLVLKKSPDGNIYTFRHGHQDNEATQVAPGVYDGISILLCSSGNITGSFFSWIWANRYYIPH